MFKFPEIIKLLKDISIKGWLLHGYFSAPNGMNIAGLSSHSFILFIEKLISDLHANGKILESLIDLCKHMQKRLSQAAKAFRLFPELWSSYLSIVWIEKNDWVKDFNSPFHHLQFIQINLVLKLIFRCMLFWYSEKTRFYSGNSFVISVMFENHFATLYRGANKPFPLYENRKNIFTD